jgi:hypothetical protein
MINNLKYTIDLMLSDDYKDRFVAEYKQLKMRTNKLATMIKKYENDELNFEPKCSLTLLKSQLAAMKVYLITLRERAEIEKIEL